MYHLLSRVLNFGKVLPKFPQYAIRPSCSYSRKVSHTFYSKPAPPPQYILTVHQHTQALDLEESFIKRCRNKFSIYLAKQRLRRSGYYLLEAIVDQINYAHFFNVLNLTNSFYSWFAITELHIWMLIVRLMAEEEEGRHVRNLVMQAFWADVQVRVKKLSGTSYRGGVSELSEQLHAAIVAYDEGLLSDDTVLAGALWRRLYQQDPLINLENLDILVKYVRRQVKSLDTATKHQLFQEMKIKWEPLQT